MEQPVRVNRQAKIITLDDYWVANTAIRYQFTPKLAFSVRVHNLFNEEYYSPTKMFAFQQGLINRSRQYLLSLEYTL
jgi:outer membrane receptor for ferric coprogen and ferric-rhodotorulic acid